ncbi:N-formylglutamate amidohydrolase [Fulvivirga sediminis]|uniref:N-formylglutamate amidohydrolase n=1 Tax=Fulvivirga sediminis TaxID=2803949 RepID=A0A937F8G1_9BACT|nr:N-formylglutamate amidohydrolase [Fulvivirga sediminis]MBL3656947.1 N-formylglutamate amidohydrolase [Fulvivirga sediminis]
MDKRTIIITCEHAGNYIPKDYHFLFSNQEDVLETHRGWDPGALIIAKYLARQLDAPLFYQKISRLLLETNRSLHNSELFSVYVQMLGGGVKQYLLDKYYHPYRNTVEDKIKKEVDMGHTVLHISMHTFTPVLNGVVRTVDVGILFDERSCTETAFSKEWKSRLDDQLKDFTVMLNVPYNGADDGFTTYLRTRFPEQKYLGIEVEVNQRYVNTPELKHIKEALLMGLSEATYTKV